MAAVFLSAFAMLISVPQIARAALTYPNFMDLKHPVTLAEPWWINALSIVDRAADDARWCVAGEDNKVAPEIYIDGILICSPTKELCWDDEGNRGDVGDLEDECSDEDGWWGSDYSKTVNGVTYTIRFWNPIYNKTSKKMYVGVAVHIDKVAAGSSHTIQVKGYWGTSASNSVYKTVTNWLVYNASDFTSLFPEDGITARRTDANIINFDGKLNSSYTTYVRTTDKADNNNDGKYYSNGNKHFTQSTFSFSANYNDLSDTNYGYHSFWFQRSIEFDAVSVKDKHGTTKTWPKTTIYKWTKYDNLPDFVKCYGTPKLKATPDMWNKKITISWEANEEDSHCKEGTWSVYRYPKGKSSQRKAIAENLGYDTSQFTDGDGNTIPEYDSLYTYEVAFIPTNAANNYRSQRLTEAVDACISRSFTISTPTIQNGDDYINLSWTSQQFGASGDYVFNVMRTDATDAKGNPIKWEKIGEVKVSSTNATSFSYKDTQVPNALTTYYYKVITTVAGKDFESGYASGKTTASTLITSLSATKGDYNGVVKISWDVKQVGTTSTSFLLKRKEKGGNGSWAVIYKTSGTEATYFYDDNTALPGKYYDYCAEIASDGSFVTDEGFCRATGVVSGRISYGTGTAVSDTRIDLKLNDEGNSGQFYAMHTQGLSGGIRTNSDFSSKVSQTFKNKAYTVQMYVCPDRDQDFTVFFDLGSKLKFLTRNGTNHTTVLKLSTGPVFQDMPLPANEYTSLTLSVDANRKATLTAIYASGKVVEQTFTAPNDYSNTGICFGGVYNATGNDSTKAFSGYVDEMRVFAGKALTREEILKNYNHTLSGSEDGLFIYWPADEGIDEQTMVYDYSKTGGVANGNHGLVGQGVTPVCDTLSIPKSNQLGLFALSDEVGNYVIRGVPFSGDGTNYMVVPSKGAHEFSPTYLTRYVSASSLVHSGVDFTDDSSFPVSGTVHYYGTNYPVKGCNLYVDGDICSKDGEIITTDDDGEFTISIPIGKHYIEIKKDGHTFAGGGRYPEDPKGLGETEEFKEAMTGLAFFDSTLVNFSGRVVGGDIEGNKPIGFGKSVNNIGRAQIVLTPTEERYSLNMVEVKNGAVVNTVVNGDSLLCRSGNAQIKSEAYRGGGENNSNKIYIRTDKATGEFSAMIPPLNYKVSPITIVKGGMKITTDNMSIDMSNPQTQVSDTLTLDDGTSQVYTYNFGLRQTYHSSPVFSVVQDDHDDGAFGVKSYTFADDGDSITVTPYTVDQDGTVNYTYGGAIFESEENYTFNIRGYEYYVNNDGYAETPTHYQNEVPLEGLKVTISNQLSSEQVVYASDHVGAGTVVEGTTQTIDVELDSTGCATYVWKAGLPNITSPFTRSLDMSYEIDNNYYTWDALPGIILGSLSSGNNFVTSGPDLIQMILRDPPGSNSFASWTNGSVTSTTKSSGDVWDSETQASVETHLSPAITTSVGFGVALLNTIEAYDDASVGVNVRVEGETADTWSTTFSTMETVSTSDQPDYVGANGDVFMGTSNNILYGIATNLGFHRDGDDISLDTKEVWTTGLQFTTSFRYTAWHIENILIPNLRSMRDNMLQTVSAAEYKSAVGTESMTSPKYITTLFPDNPKFGSDNHDTTVWGDSAATSPSSIGNSYKMIVPVNSSDSIKVYTDSVLWCNNQIQIWENALALNEEQKVTVYKDREKYLDKNYSFDAGTTINETQTTESSEGSTYDCTVVGSAVIGNKVGATINKVGIILEATTTTGGGTHVQTESTTTDVAEFAYTLADGDAADAITVDVYKYGNFGPIFRTRGGQTSGPYEGEVKTKYYHPGTTIMEATMQIEKPVIDVESAIISDIPSGSAANFTLNMSNQSETGDDVYYKLLLIDDAASSSAKITINGMPLTESRIIKIPAGETVTKVLQLYQTDLSVLDFNNVGIVLASQTQYDGTGTLDQIADTVYITAHFVPSSSPVTMALDHTTLNSSVGSDLNVSFSQFDRTYRNLKAFRIQYKKQGSTDWTTVREYVLNVSDTTGNNQLLPETGSTVAYLLPMESYSDGNYTFRVLSVTRGTQGEVTRSSNEIALVKDMQKPVPLGQPSPADGILSVGDDISITFNESILGSELTDGNFLVTGVLNGSEVDHGTALRMSNTDVAATTEADISLADKDFSIDVWVRATGPGTLLEHGNGSTKFTVSVDENYRLVVGLGSQTYTSDVSMPSDEWAFLSLSYDVQSSGALLNAAVSYDKYTTTLFSNSRVPAYEGKGKLAVGRKMQGAIHELALWDEAHDMSSALLSRSKTKNPSTAHLVGYWKMSEGEGTTITDYARNRHMHMADATWYLDNENKAVELDGTSHLDIHTAEISPLSADNCAIELWMRADKQQGETQLFTSGEVSLWMTADGMLRLTSADNTYDAGTESILDNAWHHVALNILRTGNAAVYVDGVRTFATSASNIGQTGSSVLTIGARRTNNDGIVTYDRALKGEIDEVRLWNATLNADIIKQRSHQRLTGTEDGLVAYYPFETKTVDGHRQVVTTSTADDICGSGHSATYGTALVFTDEAPALRTKPTETNVPFKYTASDKAIVIDIDADAATIEGCTLHFTVKNVSDNNGNKSSAITWSAFVSQCELAWAESTLSTVKHVADEATMSATIVNNGGQQQMWTLTGMPSWLVASATGGTTEALEQTPVTFTVSKSAPIGKHELTLYLTGNESLVTPLEMTVTVKGDEPDWSIDPKLYDGTMNLIGSLSIQGVPSGDPDDIVAAFVGNECRGTAHPVYNSRYDTYFVMMDIYGKTDDDGSPITFRVYDASTGIVYSDIRTSEETAYGFNQFVGKYASPVLLEASGTMEQILNLGAGWNWTSLYVVPDDVAATSVYAAVISSGDIVKSKNAFIMSDGAQWHGNDFDVEAQSMFKVHMQEAKALTVTGRYPAGNERIITVEPGWNWIGYNNTFTISVADAFAPLDPQDGDIVKGQTGFAMYDGYEWNGSLQALAPGSGYMLYSTTGETRTMAYPTYSSSESTYGAKLFRSQEAQLHTFTPVDHHLYSGNMCVVARVTYNGIPCANTEVGVFDQDGECRTAEVTDADGYAYFTIPGDASCQLKFYIDHERGVLTTPLLLTYATDAVYGTYATPFEVEFDSSSPTAIGFVSADSSENRWYDINGYEYNSRPTLPGIYILCATNSATGKTVTRKVVVK